MSLEDKIALALAHAHSKYLAFGMIITFNIPNFFQDTDPIKLGHKD